MNTNYETNERTENEKKSTMSRIGDVFAIIYVVMHFLPIITSIAWIIYFSTGMSYDIMYILAPFMFVGLVSAVITHPIRIIWFVLKRLAYAIWSPLVTVGIFPINIIASAICLGLSATLYLGLILFVPAGFTLYYFFEE